MPLTLAMPQRSRLAGITLQAPGTILRYTVGKVVRKIKLTEKLNLF